MLSLRDICERPFLTDYDVVLLGLDGRNSRSFLRRFQDVFASDTRRRPVVLCYYPGVVSRFLLEGMQSRMSADLVLLNSPHDCVQYDAMLRGMGIAVSNGLATGLSYLDASRCRRGAGNSIVFFAQPTVPPAVHERAYIVARLLDVARKHPRHRIVLKPRHRPGEHTLHRDRCQFADVVNTFCARDRLPCNFTLSYDPVEALLQDAAVAVTVSSSAALEALVAGVPTRILTDFGIHENLGNNFFLDSGLLCTFDEISVDLPFVLDERWSKRHLKLGSNGREQLVARVAGLLRERDERGELPLRSARLGGRSAEFRAFVGREFGPAFSDDLDSRPWRRLWWRWQKRLLGAALRHLVFRGPEKGLLPAPRPADSVRPGGSGHG
ncbi:MAG: hypothetical protein JW940_23585 [Polyangiaceae bacterium]|nr:hypothetical protein [Polyangiaceae bacterium]